MKLAIQTLILYLLFAPVQLNAKGGSSSALENSECVSKLSNKNTHPDSDEERSTETKSLSRSRTTKKDKRIARINKRLARKLKTSKTKTRNGFTPEEWVEIIMHLILWTFLLLLLIALIYLIILMPFLSIFAL